MMAGAGGATRARGWRATAIRFQQFGEVPVGTIRCHSRAREAGGGARPTDLPTLPDFLFTILVRGDDGARAVEDDDLKTMMSAAPGQGGGGGARRGRRSMVNERQILQQGHCGASLARATLRL